MVTVIGKGNYDASISFYDNFAVSVYEEQGEKSLAIKELRKILREDPENKTVNDKLEMLENKIVENPAPIPTPLP